MAPLNIPFSRRHFAHHYIVISKELIYSFETENSNYYKNRAIVVVMFTKIYVSWLKSSLGELVNIITWRVDWNHDRKGRLDLILS